MPLNGAIQPDGQELKAACTQKPLGSRESSAQGTEAIPPQSAAPRLPTCSMACSGRQLYSAPHPTPNASCGGHCCRGWHSTEKSPRGPAAEIKIPQIRRMKTGIQATGAEGASVCPSGTFVSCIPDTHGDL